MNIGHKHTCNYLTQCSGLLLEKPIVTQLVKKLPILSKTHPVHTFPPYFSKIHSNIIFPSVFRVVSSLQTKIHYTFLPHPYYMPHSSHPPWFDDNNIWWSVQVMKLLIMQSSAPCHSLPLTYTYSPQLPVLKTPSIYSHVTILSYRTFSSVTT